MKASATHTNANTTHLPRVCRSYRFCWPVSLFVKLHFTCGSESQFNPLSPESSSALSHTWRRAKHVERSREGAQAHGTRLPEGPCESVSLLLRIMKSFWELNECLLCMRGEGVKLPLLRLLYSICVHKVTNKYIFGWNIPELWSVHRHSMQIHCYCDVIYHFKALKFCMNLVLRKETVFVGFVIFKKISVTIGRARDSSYLE